jgi:hypothetical protein
MNKTFLQQALGYGDKKSAWQDGFDDVFDATQTEVIALQAEVMSLTEKLIHANAAADLFQTQRDLCRGLYNEMAVKANARNNMALFADSASIVNGLHHIAQTSGPEIYQHLKETWCHIEALTNLVHERNQQLTGATTNV